MYSSELSGLSVAELRSLLDTAIGILQDLDKGNKTILRCRDTLARLLAEFDMNDNQGTHWLLMVRSPILFALTIIGIDLAGIDVMPGPFSLSPSSAWAWQLMEPGLFGSDMSLGLAHDGSSGPQNSQFPANFEMAPNR